MRDASLSKFEQGDEAEHVFLLRYGIVKEVDGAGRVAAIHRYGDVVGASAIAEVSSLY